MIYTSQRSSIEFGKKGAFDSVEAVFKLAAAKSIIHTDGYPGWSPNPKSQIIEMGTEVWKELFASEEKKGLIFFFDYYFSYKN